MSTDHWIKFLFTGNLCLNREMYHMLIYGTLTAPPILFKVLWIPWYFQNNIKIIISDVLFHMRTFHGFWYGLLTQISCFLKTIFLYLKLSVTFSSLQNFFCAFLIIWWLCQKKPLTKTWQSHWNLAIFNYFTAYLIFFCFKNWFSF